MNAFKISFAMKQISLRFKLNSNTYLEITLHQETLNKTKKIQIKI